jgi:hypothetical protein
MPKSTQRTRSRAPFAWAFVLALANMQPTERSRHAALLKFYGIDAQPGMPAFEFTSVEELDPVVAEFRRVLGRLANAPSVEAIELSDILDVINERAQGVLKKWTWVQGGARVFPRIETQHHTFEESLYAELLMAMQVEAFTSIKQCRQCERFFYEPRRSTARFCSARCRARDARQRAGRYRQEHQEEYREYQRRLMAKRRREKKA